MELTDDRVDTAEAGGRLAAAPPPHLDHAALARAQAETEATPGRRYGPAARALFAVLDAVDGPRRTLSKCKVLELVARVPSQSWEQVAYIAITHVHGRTGLARRIHDRVVEARSHQDNESWHLLTLEELLAREGPAEGWLRVTLVPQALALVYDQASFLALVVHPAWSYRLDADVEDQARHGYGALVAEPPAWEHEAFEPAVAADHGGVDSLADLVRQISHDERVHRDASLARLEEARFR